MKYTFGKGKVAYSTNSNTVSIYKLKASQELGTGTITSNRTNGIELVFTSLKSIDKLIVDLQKMRENMIKVRVQKLMKEISR